MAETWFGFENRKKIIQIVNITFTYRSPSYLFYGSISMAPTNP